MNNYLKLRINSKYQVGMFFFMLVLLTLPGLVGATSDPFPKSAPAPTVADFLPSPAHTYYCSPTGSNTSGDGSIENPWLDLIGANGHVGPGDLIYFRGGDYPAYSAVNFSRSQNILSTNGSASNPIVITNYPGEIVTYNSTDVTWCMTLDGDYQKLIGTKVGGSFGIQITGGISIRSNNVQVSGVEFISGTSNGGDLNPAMLSVPLNDGCDQLTISHNYFHDSANAPPADRMSGIRFFTTSNSIIEYNLFKDNLELGDGACIYYKDSTTDSTVRYNTFINSLDGIEFFGQGDIHSGLVIYENLFYDVDHSFCFRSESGPGIRVYNNVALTIPAGGAFFYYLNADPIVGDPSDTGEYYNEQG